MKKGTVLVYSCRITSAALMLGCFIPLLAHAQMVNLPLPARQDEAPVFLRSGAAQSAAALVGKAKAEPGLSSDDALVEEATLTIAPPGTTTNAQDKLDDKQIEKAGLPVARPAPSAPDNKGGQERQAQSFGWDAAARQALFFTGIMHGFRFATEPESRAELRGPFFKDYFNTIRSLRGWDDGDPFIVNYIGHPMEGAVSGYIQIQNDPQGIKQEFGRQEAYWKSRLKAFGFAALFSTQFELGPLSEASLGNIGLKPTKESQHPMAWVDLVVTPTAGTAWLVGEDALDRFIVRRVENKVSNRLVRALLRSFLNPSRSMANFLRFKYPWYRDDRAL